MRANQLEGRSVSTLLRAFDQGHNTELWSANADGHDERDRSCVRHESEPATVLARVQLHDPYFAICNNLHLLGIDHVHSLV